MNKDLEKFIVNISEDDIIKEFDDTEWEDNVANAAFLGAITLSQVTDKFPEEIIHEIVSYNVLKKLRNLFISKSNPLPESYKWNSKTDESDAFAILENYIAQVTLLKQAERLDKPIILKITNTNKKIHQKLNPWCDYFQKMNSNILNISLKQINKNTYLYTFF